MVEESQSEYSDYFVVDFSSPTGLRWKSNIRDFAKTRKGGNSHAGKPAGARHASKGKVKTVTVVFRKKSIVVSRIIWEITYGKIPDGMIIDHLNGDPWDNSLSNLSLKTRAENIRNCAIRSDNNTGVVGVYFSVNKASTYVVSRWRDEHSKNKTKAFSVNKLGLLPAFRDAVIQRRTVLFELNKKHDLKYTLRHICSNNLNVL